MALCKLCGPAEISSDNRGVVQAEKKGEVNCISTGQKYAHLWIVVGNKSNDCIVKRFALRFQWTTAQATLAEKAMTPENRQVAWTNKKTHVQANMGAIKYGAEIAELVAMDGLGT